VAVTERALPTVLPVQFELHGSDVVFAADYDSLLARATKGNSVVAFQTDQVLGDGMWSVTVVGVALHLPAVEMDALRRSRQDTAITLPAGRSPSPTTSCASILRSSADTYVRSTNRSLRPHARRAVAVAARSAS
jgi:hypothetical protein